MCDVNKSSALSEYQESTQAWQVINFSLSYKLHNKWRGGKGMKVTTCNVRKNSISGGNNPSKLGHLSKFNDLNINLLSNRLNWNFSYLKSKKYANFHVCSSIWLKGFPYILNCPTFSINATINMISHSNFQEPSRPKALLRSVVSRSRYYASYTFCSSAFFLSFPFVWLYDLHNLVLKLFRDKRKYL